MNLKEIKKIIEKQGYNFVINISFLNKNYAQAIKVTKNKAQYLYYEINGNEIKIVEDEIILRELRSRYEAMPSNINYIISGTENDKYEKRKENEELKEWTKKFVGTTLRECKPFAEVYGKKFAEQRIKRLKKLYTEEESYKLAGYQCRNEITLCQKGKDGNLYSISEIENDEREKQVALHEAIHLILRHRLNETTGMKIKIPACNEQDPNGQKTLIEIGRGLNEGLTEYITEKCGYKIGGGYIELTDLIKELEVAIGEKAVISLGKGKKLPEILQMSTKEAYAFISKADRIYGINKEIIELYEILYILKKEENKENFFESNKYKKLEKDMEFRSFIVENGLKVTEENIILYCNEKIKELKKMVLEIRTDFESVLFEHYFKREFEDVVNSENISKEIVEKYEKLYKLFSKDQEQDSESIEFIRKYEILEKRYGEKLYKELMQKLTNKELNISVFLDLLDKASLNENKGLNKNQKLIIEEIARFNSPKYWDGLRELMEDLYMQDKLEQLENYSLRVIGNDDVHFMVYLENGKAFSEPLGSKTVNVTSQNIKNYDEIFNFTLGLKEIENFFEITREFEELTTNILSRNPSAEIQILERIVIINDGGNQSFYIIENGLIPAKIEEDISINLADEPLKVDIAQGTPKSMLPIKQGIKGRILNFIRQRKQDSTIPQNNTKVVSYKEKREEWINKGIKSKIDLPKKKIKMIFQEKDKEK